VRVLFTSAGRRVELIQAFTRAAEALDLRPIWYAADADEHVAASCLAHRAHCVPKVTSSRYVPALLEIARTEKIDLLVPLIDSELTRLSRARSRFARLGTGVIVSSPRVVATCRDKLRMFHFLTEHGIDTPRTWLPDDLRRRQRHRFPYFLKPRHGSASQGNFVVRDRESLRVLCARVRDAIVQDFVPGIEHTLDVYAGYDGRPRCVVPRQRIEVRGGEVTKARTVKHPGIMETGCRVAKAPIKKGYKCHL
jgi:carbamoyl-phosphate synthase large subunit